MCMRGHILSGLDSPNAQLINQVISTAGFTYFNFQGLDASITLVMCNHEIRVIWTTLSPDVFFLNLGCLLSISVALMATYPTVRKLSEEPICKRSCYWDDLNRQRVGDSVE